MYNRHQRRSSMNTYDEDEYDWETDIEGDDDDGADEQEAEDD